VYDMLKAIDKSIEIQDLYLLEKTGGKSGDFRRGEPVPGREKRLTRRRGDAEESAENATN